VAVGPDQAPEPAFQPLVMVVMSFLRRAPRHTARMAPVDGPVTDLVGPGLRVLFCGINPGLTSAATGLHFARPGNRFWRVLHESGFTDRVLDPADQALLPGLGLGITNLVTRASAGAADLSAAELRAGADRLAAMAVALAPRHVAVLGVQAYRTAFGRPRAVVGEQPQPLGSARLWVLPNPSGLQARYQLPEMAELYGRLRRAAD
jgi:TDG/mug DNA glycosylase family protein